VAGPSEGSSLDHRAASIAQSALFLILLVCGLVAPALASDTGLSGAEGHPRERFPLTVWVQPLGDARLAAALRRAVDDWNAVSRDTLGREAFAWIGQREAAQVTLAVEAATAPGLMGETQVETDAAGVIALPVRIVVFEPAARGQTGRETLLYQIAAHELGHALGLAHARDPRSLMCCVPGSVDFRDAAAREAYVEARRHPDVGSARAQLEAHYKRFWGPRD
jgi:hypothetical protein